MGLVRFKNGGFGGEGLPQQQRVDPSADRGNGPLYFFLFMRKIGGLVHVRREVVRKNAAAERNHFPLRDSATHSHSKMTIGFHLAQRSRQRPAMSIGQEFRWGLVERGQVFFYELAQSGVDHLIVSTADAYTAFIALPDVG